VGRYPDSNTPLGGKNHCPGSRQGPPGGSARRRAFRRPSSRRFFAFSVRRRERALEPGHDWNDRDQQQMPRHLMEASGIEAEGGRQLARASTNEARSPSSRLGRLPDRAPNELSNVVETALGKELVLAARRSGGAPSPRLGSRNTGSARTRGSGRQDAGTNSPRMTLATSRCVWRIVPNHTGKRPPVALRSLPGVPCRMANVSLGGTRPGRSAPQIYGGQGR